MTNSKSFPILMRPTLNLILLLALICLSLPLMANNTFDGIWRGKLQINANYALVVGLQIDDNLLTLDSPNQGMIGLKPTSFEISDSQVAFADDSISASFEGQISDNAIVGTFTQGKAMPLTLYRLNEEDIKRLKYEAVYSGDLIVNGSAKLPLNFNVAVLKGSYYATLDSPAQKSFGIPTENLVIDDTQLAFDSKLISARFESQFSSGAYEGTFHQGMSRPLALKKRTSDSPSANIPDVDLWQYGGSLAIIDNGKIDKRFFHSHSADTHYEIGSISKTMVAYLLADAVVKKDLSLDTSISSIWQEADEKITLKGLATHHSGLRRLPENLMSSADWDNPYVHFTSAMLDDSVNNAVIEQQTYEYSNFGYGVLAEYLARHQQITFQKLIQEALFAPANMQSAYLALPSKKSPTLTAGHDIWGDEVANWQFDALAGAGGVIATLDDMIAYTQWVMRQSRHEEETTKLMFTPYATVSPCCKQSLGWLIEEDEQGRTFAYHGGQTAGFSSFVGFYLDGSRAVILLNNQMSDVGLHGRALLLNG